jgi:predicted ATPase
MPKVLVTGMSGTGKSTALQALGERGHHVVDTDTDQWSRWVTLADGSTDWVWREDAVTELLADHKHGSLFVAGCKSNQGKVYPQFDTAIEPRLRITATIEIDASAPLPRVVHQLEELT